MHYKRIRIAGGCYFFTMNLAERKRTLLIDHITHLKNSISTIQQRHPFTIDAMVILPDHLHLIMTLPTGDSDYSKRVSLIKSRFSYSIKNDEFISKSRRMKRERSIWHRRFWEHYIRDERDYELHVNYIHYNPVKHGYVDKPVQWRYSSIHRYIKNGYLNVDWSGG